MPISRTLKLSTGDGLDLRRRLEGVQVGAVADERAADRDVVEKQAALVDTAVGDVPEAQQDVCPAYADRSNVCGSKPVGGAVEGRPERRRRPYGRRRSRVARAAVGGDLM